MNKKGFIFMVIVLIFLVILMSIFYTQEIYKHDFNENSVQIRIRSMNDFINDLNKDSERAAYIAGFRSLIALEEYVSETGSYLSSVDEYFKQAFFNGSIGNFSPDILNQSCFKVYLEKVNELSRTIGIQLDIKINDINSYHLDPWRIVILIDANIIIEDVGGLASWNYNETFQAVIPVDNLKDPLYSVNTLGRLESYVKKTNISIFVVNNETDNLLAHIENGYYIASTSAPSFLMRFEGDFSSSEHGIESIVDISLLEKQDDIDILDRSVVDYIYFGNQTTNDKCGFQNMPSWFRIDEEHLNTYDVNNLSYTIC